MLGRWGSLAETSKRRREWGFHWLKAILRRRGSVGRRQIRHDPVRHLHVAAAPAAALQKAIAAHERLVGDLIAATVVERAVLQKLYQSAGLAERMGGLSSASSAVGHPAADAFDVRSEIDARLLGPFEVSYRGRALAPWPSQRAASLLKFLLLHRERPVRREVVMDAFWPGSTVKSARNNLNVTVYQLRQLLRAQEPSRTHIVYDAGTYRIDPELCCRVDVDDHAHSVAQGHLAADSGDGPAAIKWYREARRLYAGPLLEGDTSGDWYIETQRRLHFEHCAVLERLCALLLDRGEAGEALTVGDELVGTDPCRETGHQLLMVAYAALDQPQLIVQQYRRCEVMLRRDLSVEVSEATVELYRALLGRR